MNKTSIQYLTHTWSPIAMRCTPIAAGCLRCWHLRRADMLAQNPKIPLNQQLRYAGIEPPFLVKSRLDAPLKVKKPSIIGVQFMGDLFHKDVSLDQINSVFIKMLWADWHTFIVLTKRPERMLDFVNIGEGWRGKMKNVWLGVSVSTQEDADRLIPVLLQIPASVRIISVEPTLEQIDISTGPTFWDDPSAGIKWVIVGAESGPKRRPCKIEWIESLVRQCVDAGVPVFVKQAEVGGKVVSTPEIMGRVWDQLPGEEMCPHCNHLPCLGEFDASDCISI